MDWAVAARRADPTTVEGRVFAATRRLVDARRSQLALRAGGETEVLFPDHPHVLAYRRGHQRSATLLALANFSDSWQSVGLGLVAGAGLPEPEHVHSTTGRLDIRQGRLHSPPWGFTWLTNR